MRKTDIQTRGRYGSPCINVKWHCWPDNFLRFENGTGDNAHEYSDDPEFWAWFKSIKDTDCSEMETADTLARESGWEGAIEDVKEIFPSASVYCEGRSGGWLVVENLPEIESWDAIMLGRWRRAVRYVKAWVADCDYQFIWHLYVNVYEPMLERKKVSDRRHTVTLTFVSDCTADEWKVARDLLEEYVTDWACCAAAGMDDDKYELEIS